MKGTPNSSKKYTSEENKLILDQPYDDGTIAKLLGRTKQAIYQQRSVLRKGKEEEMPRGQKIEEKLKLQVAVLYNNGKTQKEIAEETDLDVSSVSRILKAYGLTTEEENKDVDAKMILQKLDEMPDRLVRRISEILEFAPNMSEHLLNLESLQYKSKDKKVYVKNDGNQTKQISFFNANQIVYSTKDQRGNDIERYYFNAETIEAMFGAIFDRGWNYFKK